jgi:hypothetical protein
MKNPLSQKDIIASRDIVATDPGAPFGGGTQSMGGSPGGYTSGNEASPMHQGPPPAATNPASTWNCPKCNRMCDDAEELEKHMWDKHQIKTRRKHRE